MKARELRIGNFITAIGSLNPNDNYLTVCGLNDTSIVTKYFSDIEKHWQRVVNKDNYAPIPLTEEWLIKFGFRKGSAGIIGERYFLEQNDLSCSVEIRSGGVLYFTGDNYNDGEWSIIKTTQYVHQLQNLYYALTGEELTMIQQ